MEELQTDSNHTTTTPPSSPSPSPHSSPSASISSSPSPSSSNFNYHPCSFPDSPPLCRRTASGHLQQYAIDAEHFKKTYISTLLATFSAISHYFHGRDTTKLDSHQRFRERFDADDEIYSTVIRRYAVDMPLALSATGNPKWRKALLDDLHNLQEMRRRRRINGVKRLWNHEFLPAESSSFGRVEKVRRICKRFSTHLCHENSTTGDGVLADDQLVCSLEAMVRVKRGKILMKKTRMKKINMWTPMLLKEKSKKKIKNSMSVKREVAMVKRIQLMMHRKWMSSWWRRQGAMVNAMEERGDGEAAEPDDDGDDDDDDDDELEEVEEETDMDMERWSEELGEVVPGGHAMRKDVSLLLREAAHYISSLQLQVQALHSITLNLP